MMVLVLVSVNLTFSRVPLLLPMDCNMPRSALRCWKLRRLPLPLRGKSAANLLPPSSSCYTTLVLCPIRIPATSRRQSSVHSPCLGAASSCPSRASSTARSVSVSTLLSAMGGASRRNFTGYILRLPVSRPSALSWRAKRSTPYMQKTRVAPDSSSTIDGDGKLVLASYSEDGSPSLRRQRPPPRSLVDHTQSDLFDVLV